VNRGFAIALCVFSSFAAADTIHLKNGRAILADSVHENGTRVEYSIGDDTYAILKSSIDHIDTGVGSPSSERLGGGIDAARPQVDHDQFAEIPKGNVTAEMLDNLEKSGDTRAFAAALVAMAEQEQQEGKSDEARANMQRAVDLQPDEPAVMAWNTWLLLKTDRAAVAESYAEDAVRKAPKFAPLHKLLGVAYYNNDELQNALDQFQLAKELSSSADPELDHYLSTVARQANAELKFHLDGSTHFNMRFEGDQVSVEFRKQVLATLERHYDDLVSQLNVTPRDAITVVLYPNQAYFDVTQAPSWSGALNDGKLRIPVEGLNQVTPDLSRVLKHELTHSFINQAAAGRCPHWLNEGIAQMMEPKTAAPYRSGLARLFASSNQVPLNVLDGSFMGLNPRQAAIAYAESLAYTEYIRDKFGMAALTNILQDLGEGHSPEEALKSSINENYAQLEQDMAQQLSH
jgi:tetratricopeptide (TPR) repeat protein